MKPDKIIRHIFIQGLLNQCQVPLKLFEQRSTDIHAVKYPFQELAAKVFPEHLYMPASIFSSKPAQSLPSSPGTA